MGKEIKSTKKDTRKVKSNHKKTPKTAADYKRELIRHHRDAVKRHREEGYTHFGYCNCVW